MANYKGASNDQDIGDSMQMARCAINPQTMQSGKYRITKAKKAKNIAVIGGGIGGMEVARVASLRGHNVTIYEKTDKLGGVFIAAAAPSFKEKDKELIEWYKREIFKLNVKVMFNTEVKDTGKLDADKVVIAIGAEPKKFNVKGIEKSIEACEYLLDEKPVGETVIIVGGGLTGCEIAYDLFLKGKKPVIIEMKKDLIAGKGICLANSSYLRDFFKLNKVPVYLETTLDEITDRGIVAAGKDGRKFDIAGDTVIMSAGYKPKLMKNSGTRSLVGDCFKVGNLRTVIWRAWDIAMKL